MEIISGVSTGRSGASKLATASGISSGEIIVSTGFAMSGTSGDMKIVTGDAEGGSAGTLSLSTGHNDNGQNGDFNILGGNMYLTKEYTENYCIKNQIPLLLISHTEKDHISEKLISFIAQIEE